LGEAAGEEAEAFIDGDIQWRIDRAVAHRADDLAQERDDCGETLSGGPTPDVGEKQHDVSMA
jgi:hypothetical protein